MVQTKREKRHSKILEQLRDLIREKGFFDLKISELAKRCELSIGTIYSHFSCKEDLLMTLALESISLRLEQARLAVKREQDPAERFISANLAGWRYAHANPSLVETEFLAMSPSIWKRTSPLLYKEYGERRSDTRAFFATLIDEACEHLGLEICPVEKQKLLIGTWSLAVGTDVIYYASSHEKPSETAQWEDAQLENLSRLLSGWGWPRDTSAHRVDARPNVG
jgi:AcrR family transcriptional regulator